MLQPELVNLNNLIVDIVKFMALKFGPVLVVPGGGRISIFDEGKDHSDYIRFDMAQIQAPKNPDEVIMYDRKRLVNGVLKKDSGFGASIKTYSSIRFHFFACARPSSSKLPCLFEWEILRSNRRYGRPSSESSKTAWVS